MRTCAIDIHHHYVPNSLLEEAKKNGKHLGVEFAETGEQGENWCNVYNEGIKELIKRYPDRFVGMASVPLQDPVRAAKVLEHAVVNLKLHGGYIGTNVNGTYYNTTDFDPFWAKAQELDVLVIMHPEDVAGGAHPALRSRWVRGLPGNSSAGDDRAH